MGNGKRVFQFKNGYAIFEFGIMITMTAETVMLHEL
jgi:hypothetical protein